MRSLYEKFTQHTKVSGPVRMKNPGMTITVAFDYGHIGSGSSSLFG